MPTVLLVVGVVCALYALNAFFPRRDRFLLLPSFFSAWLTVELAPWWLFWQVVAVVVLVAAGGLDDWYGWAGLVLLVAATAGLAALIARNRRTIVEVSEGLEPLELDPDETAPAFPRSHVVFPFLTRRRPSTVVVRNLEFARAPLRNGKVVTLRLDVTKPSDAAPGDRRPGLLQVHGGGWVIGDKREQGLPLVNHMAANGWVAINANYRLSPRVAAPEHLIDVKRAIAWWRAHADEHGGDPDFLCITGGSAGGHLTALAALSPNDARYQPDFEDVDTALNGAVPFYGVYDFTNRLGTWHRNAGRRFLEPIVMQRRLADDPDAFRDYSPLDLVRRDAPPLLVIHGSNDTLAPVDDAREFVQRLRELSDAPVLYMEMRGAQHAFDIFPSYRTARVVEGVERFLTATHRTWAAARPSVAIEPELADELSDDAPMSTGD